MGSGAAAAYSSPVICGGVVWWVEWAVAGPHHAAAARAVKRSTPRPAPRPTLPARAKPATRRASTISSRRNQLRVGQGRARFKGEVGEAGGRARARPGSSVAVVARRRLQSSAPGSASQLCAAGSSREVAKLDPEGVGVLGLRAAPMGEAGREGEHARTPACCGAQAAPCLPPSHPMSIRAHPPCRPPWPPPPRPRR